MPLFIAIFISTLPFLWLFSQIKIMGDFTGAFANIAGLLGSVLMLWQLILGNRFIARNLSRNYISLIKLHTFLGIYGFFFVLTHPFLEMIAYGQSLAFLFIPDFSSEFGKHLILGRLAIYLYLFVWITSALIRNKISYRVWRYLHYLSYPVLFFTFLHAVEIGTFLNTFILLKVYFYLMMAVFAAAVIYRLSQLLDVGKFPYVLFDKKTNKTDITTYHFRPMAISLTTKIGQFFFIKPNIFAESHPFTVMNFDEKSGELVFAIKAIGNFTNQLETVQVGQTVSLDGPYGVFTKEAQNDEPKVIIAGGIGITPFVELVNRFGQKNTKLFYANRFLKDAVSREQFKEQLGANYIDIISGEKLIPSADVAVQGRLDEKILAAYLTPEFMKQANFFVCGSPGFMGGVFMALKKLGIDKERIFVEEFSL